jgi:glycerophosphoryl diester phosphodiesterase
MSDSPRTPDHPYFDVPRPSVLGHRGAAGSAPENTLASFSLALEHGAHILESDVHITRDGVPVLIHDPEIDRTTEGRGRVSTLRFDELRRFDAGYRYSADDGRSHPERGRGHRVPSLAEAFEGFPDARFNLELKAAGDALPEAVLALVAEFDRADRTLLTAGEDADMACLRAALPGSPARPAIGASLADILEVVRAAVEGRAPETDSMAIQIPESFGGRPLVTEQLVRHAHDHGVAVHVWTINAIDSMHALLDLGVDGLVTDHPGRLAAVLRDRSARR